MIRFSAKAAVCIAAYCLLMDGVAAQTVDSTPAADVLTGIDVLVRQLPSNLPAAASA